MERVYPGPSARLNSGPSHARPSNFRHEPPGYGLHFPLNGDIGAAVLLPRDLLEQLELERLEIGRTQREEVQRLLAIAEEQRRALIKEQGRSSERRVPPPPPVRPLSPLEAARALTVPGYVPQLSSDTIAVFDRGAAQKRFHALKNPTRPHSPRPMPCAGPCATRSDGEAAMTSNCVNGKCGIAAVRLWHALDAQRKWRAGCGVL